MNPLESMTETNFCFGEGNLLHLPPYLADTIDWLGVSQEYQKAKTQAGIEVEGYLDTFTGDKTYWDSGEEIIEVDRSPHNGRVIVQLSPYVAFVVKLENGRGDLSRPRSYDDFQKGNAVLAYVPGPRWFREVLCGNTKKVIYALNCYPYEILHARNCYPYEMLHLNNGQNLVRIEEIELSQVQTLLAKVSVPV